MTVPNRTPDKAVAADPNSAAFDAAPPFDALEDTVETGQAMFQSGLLTWASEGQRFVQQMITDGQDALAQFARCTSPDEVMLAQQAWMAARAKAYVESGLRLADGSTRPLGAGARTWPFGD